MKTASTPSVTRTSGPASDRASSRHWCAMLLVLAGTLACYWQVWSFEFVSYDDTDYVSRNAHVQRGLTAESMRWAFTQSHASNWHPLTWLSHMLDWQIYRDRAGGHHFTNVVLHCANTLLLFLLLRKITGARWRSVFVAALFALHPLHVESVAWVAERKDVLSTFFGFLSLLFYSSYARQGASKRHGTVSYYVASILFFGMSLMSKPMLVTLPFVLLLLDVWPLARVPVGWRRLFVEKFPFLCLSLASSFITVRVQSGKTMQTLSDFSVTDRLANVIVSYAGYLQKTIWPADLAFFYPLVGAPSLSRTFVSAVVLIAITAFALLLRRRHPAVLVGWLWYLGTLVPVIGFVHVGEQAMADRYTYIPLIGIFIAVAWYGSELIQAKFKSLSTQRLVCASTVVAVGIAMMAVTYRQIGYWRNSKVMLERALAVTEQNFLAHNNYGVVLAESGDYAGAIEHYRRATEIKPLYARAFCNLGAALTMSGNIPEAVAALEKALSLRPNDPETHYNLAVTWARRKEYAKTIYHCRRALELDPGYAIAHFDLGLALSLTGDQQGAIHHFRVYLQIFPQDQQARALLSQIEQLAGN